MRTSPLQHRVSQPQIQDRVIKRQEKYPNTPLLLPTEDLCVRSCHLLLEYFLGSALLCFSLQACHGSLRCLNATSLCSQGVGRVCACLEGRAEHQPLSKFTPLLPPGLPSGSQLTTRYQPLQPTF